MDTEVASQLVGFRRQFRAEVAGEVTYLFSERGMTTLRGSEVSAVAPLLDGTRSLETVLDESPDGVSREQAAAVVAQLTDAGLVTLRPPDTEVTAPEETLAYWDAMGLDADAAVAGVTTKQVGLFTHGEVDTVAAWTALRAAGLAVTAGLPLDPVDLAEAVDLAVVLTDDYLRPCLAETDLAMRVAKVPWLLAKPGGGQVWVGPLFQPEQAGCWHCLAAPLRGHRHAETCASEALGQDGPISCPAPSVQPLSTAAMSLVALEATKAIAGQRYPGQRGVWIMDGLDLNSRHHQLRARPQCPECGDPDLMRTRARRPVELINRPRAVGMGSGGHRALPPEEVLDTYQHLISPVTGVVKEIKRDTRGPALFQSYRSGTNVAQGIRTLDSLRTALRVENGGKGVTALDARVGALCEAVERYSGTYQGDEQIIRGSLRGFGQDAVDPRTCQLFHERQYRDRTGWNAAHAPFQHVCDPFDGEATLDWTPVWSLTQRRHRLLPTGMLYFGAPTEPGPRFVFADSNGNAAGSSLEDAVLQGVLELVERDAVAMWWYNRARVPGIDLASYGDAWLDDLRGVYADLGREVWALDVTSDLGIPAVVAVSRRTDADREDIIFGFGAHLDSRLALRRALTELNQLMPNMIGGAADRHDGADPDASRWWREATVENQPYLLADDRISPRGPGDGHQPGTDLLADIEKIHAKLVERGMELLVLDQTRPDVGLPVVKVIVPGMRHFWARFAPGRLYDVPVALGLCAEPTPYEELNPYPLFL